MDYIRRGNNLSSLTVAMILSIVILVLLNDYMDFVSTEGTVVTTKVIFGVFMCIIVGLLIYTTMSMNKKVSEMIHHEKK